MSAPTDPRNPHKFPPFSGDTIVFRAAKSKAYFSADRTKGAPLAFYRRPLTSEYPDHKGLSVDTSRENILNNMKGKFYGYISLKVGAVRSLKLEVLRDSETHGNITDGEIELPFRHPTDMAINAQVELLANALAEASQAHFEMIPAQEDR